MTGDNTASAQDHRSDAFDEIEAAARRILDPGFDGDAVEAIRAAADYVATLGDDRLAHWFTDLLLDLEAHDCINDEWCYVSEVARMQREGRR